MSWSPIRPNQEGKYWGKHKDHISIVSVKIDSYNPGKFFTNVDGGCWLDNPLFDSYIWWSIPIESPEVPKILILEDNKDRQRAFFNKYGRNNVLIVDTAEACIKALENQSWDILFLDHDLGEGKTGYDVACWLEEHNVACLHDRIPGTIVIHSNNVVGVKRMKAALPDAIVIPDAWLVRKDESDW